MYDVVKNYEKVGKEWIDKYSVIEESASINECMEVSGSLNHEFRPVWPESRAVGAALTVRARPGDNLIIHKAISMIKPGDILVVTCDGFQESGGMFGGIMSTSAKKMGASGLIIDGCVRDTMMMKKVGFPVWSRGISIKKSTKLTGGQINVPIVIGGVLVNPGDLIFADNDAVVCIPREKVAETYEKAMAREAHEDNMLERVLSEPELTTYNDDFRATYEALGLREEADPV
ncbi:MAG: 4-carboxy-4-hydroxy-2-oxoadipate aldolase/oxaloacetate decarboxylase [Enterocloster sp.]